MTDLFHALSDPLQIQLFKLGGADFTVGSLVATLAAIVLLFVFAGWLRRWMIQRLLARGHLDASTRATVSSLTQYVVLALGFVLILDSIGVKLSSFTVLAGALGVGVGFGLQNIFSNFISGLIVMFERPVKIGDHVIVAGAEGDVVGIGMRATTLRNAAGNLILVPNQNFITGNVINLVTWDRSGNAEVMLQFRMQGAVPEDEALLLRVLQAEPKVLKQPAPAVFVAAADHAGHVMEVHFWASADPEQRLAAVSRVNQQLLAELQQRGQALAPNP